MSLTISDGKIHSLDVCMKDDMKLHTVISGNGELSRYFRRLDIRANCSKKVVDICSIIFGDGTKKTQNYNNGTCLFSQISPLQCNLDITDDGIKFKHCEFIAEFHHNADTMVTDQSVKITVDG